HLLTGIVHDIGNQIDCPAIRTGRDRVAGTDVYDMQFNPGFVLFGLDGHQTQGTLQTLQRASAGPEVTRHSSCGNITVLGNLPFGSRHVAVLALLPAKSLLVEIITPLEKSLRLLVDDTFSHAVAVSAHGRGLYCRVCNSFVRRLYVMGGPDLPFRCQMAAGTSQAPLLHTLWPRLGLGHFRNIQIRNGKGFRIVTDIARPALFLKVPGMSWKGVHSGKCMGRSTTRDSCRKVKFVLLGRLQGNVRIVDVCAKAMGKLVVNGFVALAANFGWSGSPLGKVKRFGS